MKFFLSKRTFKDHFYDIGKLKYSIYFYGYEPPGISVENLIGKTREAILIKYRNQEIIKDYNELNNEIDLHISLNDATLMCSINAETGLCEYACLFKKIEESYLNLVGDYIYPN